VTTLLWPFPPSCIYQDTGTQDSSKSSPSLSLFFPETPFPNTADSTGATLLPSAFRTPNQPFPFFHQAKAQPTAVFLVTDTTRKNDEAQERGRESMSHQLTNKTVTVTAITYSPKRLKGTTYFIVLR